MYATILFDECGEVIDAMGPYESDNQADQIGQNTVKDNTDENESVKSYLVIELHL